MTDGCTVRMRRGRCLTITLALLAMACTREPEASAAVAGSAAVDASAAAGGAEARVGDIARPYAIRLDSESSDASLFDLVEDDGGIHVRTGPAGIAYRADDAIPSGDFHVEATFALYDAPVGYREAYGIFVGGSDLDGADQEYTYLLVRPTGEFLIKRRIGEITETFLDWTPDASVAAVARAGDEPSNTLAVDVVGAETRFSVNGVTLATLPTGRVRPHGVAGVRVNHRLDVRVDDWIVTSALDS